MSSLAEALSVELRRSTLAPVAIGGPTVFEQRAPDGTPQVTIFRTPSHYRMHCFDCITVEVERSGPVVTVDARPPATDADVEDLLVSVVLPLVGQLRGHPTLHASAILLQDRGVGFVGPTGAGKSTLAALMAQRGARLLADDTLLLELREGELWATPTSSRVRLREAARVGVSTVGAQVRTNGKLAIPLEAAAARARFAQLYVIDPASEDVVIEPLRPRDAAIALAHHLFRIDPKSPELLREEFAFVEAVAANVPIARLSYPRRPEVADELFARFTRELDRP